MSQFGREHGSTAQVQPCRYVCSARFDTICLQALCRGQLHPSVEPTRRASLDNFELVLCLLSKIYRMTCVSMASRLVHCWPRRYLSIVVGQQGRETSAGLAAGCFKECCCLAAWGVDGTSPSSTEVQAPQGVDETSPSSKEVQVPLQLTDSGWRHCPIQASAVLATYITPKTVT